MLHIFAILFENMLSFSVQVLSPFPENSHKGLLVQGVQMLLGLDMKAINGTGSVLFATYPVNNKVGSLHSSGFEYHAFRKASVLYA